MSKNQKILFVSVGLIGLGLYLFYKQGKQDSELAKESESDSNTDVSRKADYDKILKKGSKGVEVGILQRALKQLKDDEDFGALTESRLKKVTGLTEITLNQYNTIIENKK
jgi:hypothetical protein